MTAIRILLLIALAAICAVEARMREDLHDMQENRHGDIYTASWAVEITDGGKKMADVVAQQNGFINLGKVYMILALAIAQL